jgi:hypothetical protein
VGGAVDGATVGVEGLSALPGAVGTQTQSFHSINSQVISAQRVSKGKVLMCRVSVIGATKWGGCRAAATPLPQIKKIQIF